MTTNSTGTRASSETRPPLLRREYLLPFILLTICFPAWAVANNMTDPLVRTFSRIFTMSTFQSSLVQFSFYGAYFCLAIPAAILIKRYTYKTGVLVGLGLFIVGALLFFPASRLMEFNFFLMAIFVLASGLSVLETSCNPYIIAMGDEKTATRRLNLAQAFNPVGAVLGAMLAGFFILPKINPLTDAERALLSMEEVREIRAPELAAVMGPYLGMAVVLIFLWLAIAFVRMPRASDAGPAIDFQPTLRRLLNNRHYSFGVVAQFFYVAAQICVWTFTIHYVADIVANGEGESLIGFLEATGIIGLVQGIRMIQPDQMMTGETVAGIYHVCALFVFLIFRFVCTGLMHIIRPSAMLLGMAVLGLLFTLLVMGSPNLVGVLALIAISGCMSLMFPTIYGIALHGLGDDTKLGAAGLIMAILGGALFPLLQGALVDAIGAPLSYAVPLVCFAVVAAYAVFDLKGKRQA
jgi:MFS transporter, FHS family, L-fucose permease